ncbi:MAG: hypothetical protein HY903_20150 [Deltaproteobacteria bacterium]|nr:hypothetical protein [Deltaproteobacteria bacterium]
MKPALGVGLVAALAVVACEDRAAAPRAQARAQRITYAHGGEVVVRDGVKSGPEKARLKNATDPCLSPDGRWLGLTRTAADGRRALAVIDLETTAEAPRPLAKARQVYGCMFSADGAWMAYNVLFDTSWQVGAMRADGSEPRLLTAGLGGTRGWFLAGVNRKTGGIFAQDMDDLVELGADGAVRSRTRLAGLLGDYGVSSGCRFFVDPRGVSLFAEVESDESLPGLDGPTGILLAIDLGTKKRERLTPARLSAAEPWLDANGDSLYFTGCAPKAGGGAVACAGYRLQLATRTPELWVKGGAHLSTSDP